MAELPPRGFAVRYRLTDTVGHLTYGGAGDRAVADRMASIALNLPGVVDAWVFDNQTGQRLRG